MTKTKETIPASEQLRATYEEYVMPTYAPSMALARGKGCTVWDAEGKSYLDFVSGIAVSSLGHAHPALLKAIRKQSARLIHCSNLYINEQMPRLAERLSKLSLGGKVFFCNSGAEANEGLIKLARYKGAQPGRYEIITVRNSFHGRTMATLSATAQNKIQQGFSPLAPGFKYGSLNNIESVKQQIAPETVAIMVEGIQGEGGVVLADKTFMEELRELCDQHRLLLLMDEIQTGIGRTGKWFSYQHFDIEPDAISVAKGLGGGFPIGALVTKPEFSNIFNPGSHGTTFGGNPLACAAAHAVLDTIEKENLLEHAAAMGQLMVKRLQKLVEKYDFIEEVRGQGLMIGLVMDRPAKPLEQIITRKGLLTLATAERVIRMLPPLTVKPGEVKKAVKIINAACQEWQAYMTKETEE